MAGTPMGTVVSKLGHQPRDMSSFYGAAWPFLCPNRPFPRWADVGQRENGRSVEKNLFAVGRAWAVLGGVQSGWEQFGEAKKKTVVMPGRRVQLSAIDRCAIPGYLLSRRIPSIKALRTRPS